MDVKGQGAIVTGGASGLGGATAAALAAAGAKVAILDLNEQLGTEHAKAIGGVFVKCNVADGPDAERAVAEAVAKVGAPRVAVNCAGIGVAQRTISKTGPHALDFFARVKLRPAEYALISVLEQRPGLSQTDAANMLGIKRANFVSLLDTLESRGLAERRAVDGDRRSRTLHLTEKGHVLAAKAERIATAYDEMLVARLGGPEERDRFLAMLDRLMAKD